MSGDPVWLPHDWFPRPLPPNVIIGERGWVYSTYACGHYASNRPCGLRIGHDTGVYVGTMFDLGPEAEVEIGAFCTLNGPIFATNGHVQVGDYALLSLGVVIADGFAATPPRQVRVSRPPPAPIVIEDDVWIGTRAILLPGARIGAGAIVGAAAVVDFAVPAGAIVAGNPARVVGNVASGVVREGSSRGQDIHP